MMAFKHALLILLAILGLPYAQGQEVLLPEVLHVEQLLFDGKLQRFFLVQEFEAHFHQPDSTALLIDVQPCNYIFEYEDGSKDADDAYWYKDRSRFERSRQRMAVDEFWFTKDHFILYNGIRLDASTTFSELAELFPKAANMLAELDAYGGEKLQVLTFREDEKNISDGKIRLFLKDGKPYFIQWWFPC